MRVGQSMRDKAWGFARALAKLGKAANITGAVDSESACMVTLTMTHFHLSARFDLGCLSKEHSSCDCVGAAAEGTSMGTAAAHFLRTKTRIFVLDGATVILGIHDLDSLCRIRMHLSANPHSHRIEVFGVKRGVADLGLGTEGLRDAPNP